MLCEHFQLADAAADDRCAAACSGTVAILADSVLGAGLPASEKQARPFKFSVFEERSKEFNY